ncbi:hypothetical protein LSM04_004836 [Trypanosoma melophagium]|uniref:uncharacterized protein n=1 Tax=Trypanosoma melophagium TaxID=715481 RepID=UPI00351A4592|nr:hypothetical protein LSM04_004836 [Trypanosoma melophagium]
MLADKNASFYRKNSPSKDRSSAVVIPNIPKVTDERARMKLLTDYDRYEQELFKHHIGTPETTRTIGLKLVPATFDRRLPAQNDPTTAECELEARRRQKRMEKQASTRGSFAAFPPAVRETSASRRTVADTQMAASLTGGGGTSGASQTPNLRASTQPGLPVPIPDHVMPLSSRQSKAARRGENMGNSTTGSTGLPVPGVGSTVEAKTQESALTSTSPKGALQRSKTQKLTATVTPPVSTTTPPPPPPPQQQQQQQQKQQPKQQQQQQQQKQQQKQQTVVAEHTPIKKETRVVGNTPQTSVQPFKKDTVLKSSDAMFAAKSDSALTAERCGQLLQVLLDTPPEYSESFHLDLRHIDLGWMRGSRYPTSLVTLQTWRPNSVSDGIGAGSSDSAGVPSLNSPRSVIVLLGNGVVVNDLIPHEIREDDPLLPKDPETRHLVKRMRLEGINRARENLLQNLRSDYAVLCRRVNLPDILKAFHTEKKREITVELPTSIKEGHERRKRILEIEKKRMEKQLAFTKDVLERQLIAEERKRQLEEEAKARIEQKKQEEQLAHQRAVERLAAQKQKAAEAEAQYQKDLQERLQRAEEKNAKRIEAQQRLYERRREERQKLAEERQARFERRAEVQEQQKLQAQHKREKKEEKIKLMREEQERKRQEMHEKMVEKAAKSVELRELVRQRAALQEERVRQAALEQQRKVEERLLRFQKSHEEARAQRIKQEEEKRERLKEVYNTAASKLAAAKEEILEKDALHEKSYNELQHQRQVETLTKREHEREVMESKAFAVLRSKRMTEFGKLEAVLQLLKKRDMANYLDKQREMLMEETRKSHATLLSERNALKAEISRQN